MTTFLLIIILILIVNTIRQNEKIRILENNYENALRVIEEYDPKFKAYRGSK